MKRRRRWRRSWRKRASEISLAFLEFHRAFFVVVDGPVFTFGPAERNHFFDDLRQRVGIGTDGWRAGNASEGAHAALEALRFLSPQELRGMVDDHNGTVAKNHIAFLRKIERHDGNLFHVDVKPDVQLGPVGERKHANAFAFVKAAVEY